MQFAGESTRIAGKNTHQMQAKINGNAGKNTRTIAGKIPAIAQKIIRTCRQSAITPQVNSPSNCRLFNLHPAGEVTCNLRALLGAVAAC